jgi:hypothetical protein
MLDQVERDLDVTAIARCHGSGRKAAHIGQQRDVRPVIARRHERHASLADDMTAAVQRLPRIDPGIERDLVACWSVNAHDFAMGNDS